jgi:hypothetical protein
MPYNFSYCPLLTGLRVILSVGLANFVGGIHFGNLLRSTVHGPGSRNGSGNFEPYGVPRTRSCFLLLPIFEASYRGFRINECSCRNQAISPSIPKLTREPSG